MRKRPHKDRTLLETFEGHPRELGLSRTVDKVSKYDPQLGMIRLDSRPKSYRFPLSMTLPKSRRSIQ